MAKKKTSKNITEPTTTEAPVVVEVQEVTEKVVEEVPVVQAEEVAMPQIVEDIEPVVEEVAVPQESIQPNLTNNTTVNENNTHKINAYEAPQYKTTPKKENKIVNKPLKFNGYYWNGVSID